MAAFSDSPEVAIQRLGGRADLLSPLLNRVRQVQRFSRVDFPEALLRPEGGRSLKSYQSEPLSSTSPLFSELNRLIESLQLQPSSDTNEIRTVYDWYIDQVRQTEGRARWRLLKGEVRLVAQLQSGPLYLIISRKVAKEAMNGSPLQNTPAFFFRSMDSTSNLLAIKQLACQLGSFIIGQEPSPLPLVRFENICINEQRISRTFELSSTAKGEPLFDLLNPENPNNILEQLPDVISHLDFSYGFLLDLLSLPTHGEASCFQIIPSPLEADKKMFQSIRCGGGFNSLARCQSIRFLLDPLMGLPLHSSWCDIILNLNVDLLLVKWMISMNRYNNSEEGKSHPATIAPSMLSYHDRILSDIQKLLKVSKGERVTHVDVLRHVHPKLYERYRALIIRYPGRPLEAEKFLAQDEFWSELGSTLEEAKERASPLSALQSWMDSFFATVDEERRGTILHQIRSSEESVELFFKEAVLHSHLNLAQALTHVEEAVPPNLSDLLREVIERGSPNAFNFLADLGALVNERGLLHLMVERDRIDLIPLLSERLGAAFDVNEKINGCTPLHLAVLSGKMAIANALLSREADPLLADELGNSALYLAASSNSPVEFVELILNSTPMERRVSLIHLANNDGYTPLHATARRNQVEVARLLLEAGGRTDLPNSNGATPFDLALKWSSDAVARLFIFPSVPSSSEEGIAINHLSLLERQGDSHLEAKKYRLASSVFANCLLTARRRQMNPNYLRFIEEKLKRVVKNFLFDSWGIHNPPLENQRLICDYHNELEAIRSQVVEAIGDVLRAQALIGRGCREFLAKLFQESLDLIPPLPSRFALIAIDELSRDELFPSSNLKVAILVEKEGSADFFIKLGQLFEVKVSALSGSFLKITESDPMVVVGTPQEIAQLLGLPLHSSLLLGNKALLEKLRKESKLLINQKEGSFFQLRRARVYQTQATSKLKSRLLEWQRIRICSAHNRSRLDLDTDLLQPLERALRALLFYFNQSHLTTRAGIQELPLNSRSKRVLARIFHHASTLLLRAQVRGEEVSLQKKAVIYRFLNSFHRFIFDFVHQHNRVSCHLTYPEESELEIHAAAKRGETLSIQAIVARGEKVDQINIEGYNPLHLAIIHRHLETTTFLLGHFQGIIPLTEDRATPLHLAVSLSDPRFVELVLTHYNPQKQLLKTQDITGDTALHWAIRGGNFEVIALLLRTRMWTEMTNKRGETLLSLALEKEDDRIARCLLFGEEVALSYSSDLRAASSEMKSREREVDESFWEAVARDNLHEQMFCLIKRAFFYLEEQKPDYWQAALFLNSACSIAEDSSIPPQCREMILHQLEELERQFIRHEMGVRWVRKGQNQIAAYRGRLSQIRESIALSVSSKEPIHHTLSLITQSYKALLRDLFNESVEIIGRAPPTRFAMAGLGSMSREEICPYSDVEFIFLVEREDEEIQSYFRSIARLMALRIANFGETEFKLVQRKGQPAESFTPSGFSMDGQLSPLGVGGLYGEGLYELIGTVERLAEFQTKSCGEHGEVILVNALRTVCYIAGDETFISHYQREVEMILNQTGSSSSSQSVAQTLRQTRALELIRGYVQEFEPKFNQERIDLRAFDVKKGLYRFPQSVISALALYYNVKGNNTIEQINGLKERRVFSSDGANNLKSLLSFLFSLRVDTHLFYKKEVEVVYYPERRGLQPESESEKLFQASPFLQNNIIEAYRKLMPFCKSTRRFLDGDEGAFAHSRFYDSKIGGQDKPEQRAALKPTNEHAYLELGIKQFESGEVKGAVKSFKKGLALLNAAMPDRDTNYKSIFLSNLGGAYVALGKADKAVRYYEESLEMSAGGVDDADILSGLGEAYRRLKRFAEALHAFQESLKILQGVHSDRPGRSVAALFHNLGSLYRDQGEMERAIESYHRSLDIARQLESERLGMTIPLKSLGSVYIQTGQLDQAIECFTSSLSILGEVHKEFHADIAVVLIDLVSAYEKIGRPQIAIEFCESFFKKYETTYLSVYEINVAKMFDKLGSLYDSLNDLDKSIECYKRARFICGKVDNDEARYYFCDVLNNLGSAYAKKGKFNKAYPVLTASLSQATRLYGQGAHPDIARTRGNLGTVCGGLGLLPQAFNHYQIALSMLKELYGDQPRLETAEILGSLAAFSYEVEECDKAAQYYHSELSIRQQLSGGKSCFEVAATLNNLGLVYLGMGDLREALKNCHAAFSMRREIYGERPHLDLVNSLNNLATIHKVLGDFPTAIGYYDSCLAIQRQLHPSGIDQSIATTLKRMGFVYEQLGDRHRAIESYKGALEILNQIQQGEPDDEVATLLNSLADLHQELEEYEQSMKYYSSALQIKERIYGSEPRTEVAVILINLGDAHTHFGDFTRAIEVCERAITMLQKTEGLDCPLIKEAKRSLREAKRGKWVNETMAHYRDQERGFELGPANHNPDISSSSDED